MCLGGCTDVEDRWRYVGLSVSSCCCLHPCPCDMSFSFTSVGLPSSQSVSSVTSVLLTQGFVVSPVPDSTTRALDHTF